MKKLFFLILFIQHICIGQNLLNKPECVSYHETSGSYYVSNVGDGSIICIDSNGNQSLFKSGLTMCLSNVIHNHNLYVSLGKTIKGYNLTTGNEIMSLYISAASQMDGMAVDTSGNLYVTDYFPSAADKIYKINLNTQQYHTFASAGLQDGIQDLVYDAAHNRLVVVNFSTNSTIQAVNLTDSTVTNIVNTTIGQFDGIAQDAFGNYYLSSWATHSIYIYNSTFTNPPDVVWTDMNGPSNLSYNITKNILIAPSFNGNTIHFIPLDFARAIFTEYFTVNNYYGTMSVFASDINSDGYQDILGAAFDSNKINWWENVMDTAFIEHEITNSFSGPRLAISYDMNQDGNEDIIATSAWDNTITIWNQDSSGNFLEKNIVINYDGAHSIAVADLNNDTLPDLLACAWDDNYRYFLNLGQDSFLQVILSEKVRGTAIEAADMDNDCDLDIIGANYQLDGGIIIWEDTGNNDYVEKCLLAFPFAHWISINDIDDDGDMDIAASSCGSTVLWYENNGDYQFTTHVLANDCNCASAINTADLDYDGDMDIIAAAETSQKVTWWANLNNQHFVRRNIANLNGASSVCAKDMDHDGDLDVLAAGRFAHQLKMWKNQIFTSPNHAPKANFKIDYPVFCPGTSIKFSDKSLGYITDYFWNFGSGANPQNATGQGPHAVTYDSTGARLVTLTVQNPYGSNSKSLLVTASEDLQVYVLPDSVQICEGESVSLHAYGAPYYQWFPATGLNMDTGNHIIAQPDTTMIYQVTGVMGYCSGVTSVKIEIINNQNDDVCSAKHLSIGNNGPFNNSCATKQNNEACPPITSCTGQMSWCPEGGVQNSLWFTFSAPASGRVRITTSGFDCQIAVYQADSCSGLINNDYTLLAANDDISGTNANAKINDLRNLIYEKDYFLQLDGSAGGARGIVNINIEALPPIQINEYDELNSIMMYPNPANNMVYIKGNNKNKKIDYSIISISGNTLLSGVLKFDSDGVSQLNVSTLTNGIYYLHLNLNHQKNTRKIIILNK